MTNRSASSPIKPTTKQVDEAAVWMTLLHGSDRSAQTDAGFRRWLKAHPAHPKAFEKVSTAHELTAALPRTAFPRVARWERAGYRAGFRKAWMATAAVIVAVFGGLLLLRDDSVETGPGEQRTLALADGSQIHLNTATRVAVKYTDRERRVELQEGEAFFDVARAADRSFVVAAAGREVTALGTSFVVRRDHERVAVTLVEGKVAVRETSQAQPTLLAAGERIVYDGTGAAVHKDRPTLEKETAWRRGLVDFDDVPLRQAVEEMNRYSSTQLVVGSHADPAILITGVFKVGALKSFAAAVADEYHLTIEERSGEIVLDRH